MIYLSVVYQIICYLHKHQAFRTLKSEFRAASSVNMQETSPA